MPSYYINISVVVVVVPCAGRDLAVRHKEVTEC